MNPIIAKEYESINSSFKYSVDFLKSQVLGRMELMPDEEVIKGEFFDISLGYILTNFHILAFRITKEGTYFISQKSIKKDMEMFGFSKSFYEDDQLTAYDAFKTPENELVVLVANKHKSFSLKRYQVKGKITELSHEDICVDSPCLFHRFNNVNFFLEGSFNQISVTFPNEPEVKKVSIPQIDKSLVQNFSPFNSNCVVKFFDRFFFEVINDSLQILDLEEIDLPPKILHIDSESPIIQILRVDSEHFLLVNKKLEGFLVIPREEAIKKLPPPVKKVTLDDEEEFSCEESRLVAGGERRKIYFKNTSDKKLYKVTYGENGTFYELCGIPRDPSDFLIASFDRIFLTLTRRDFNLSIFSFKKGFDRVNERSVYLKFGLALGNTLFLQELGKVIFAESQMKLYSFDLETKNLIEAAQLDGPSLGLFETGIGSTFAVVTKNSVKVYDPEKEFAEAKVLLESSEGYELSLVTCSNPLRFAVVSNSDLFVFESAKIVFKIGFLSSPTFCAVHPTKFYAIIWEDRTLSLWNMEQDKKMKSLQKIETQNLPSSTSFMEDLIILSFDQVKVVFLNSEDLRMEYMISTPPQFQGRAERLKVLPLFAKNDIAIYNMKELRIIDRKTFRLKLKTRLENFQMIRGIFASKSPDTEYYVLSQHVFGHNGKITSFNNILKKLCSAMPRAKGITMIAQNTNLFDAVYIRERNRIRIIKRDYWSFHSIIPDVPPLVMMDFARSFKENWLIMLTEDSKLLQADVINFVGLQELEIDQTMTSQTFCLSPEVIYLGSKNTVVSFPLGDSKGGESKMKKLKEVTVSYSPEDPIQKITYYKDPALEHGMLFTISKRGIVFSFTDNLDKLQLLFAPTESSPLDAKYMVSSTGAFGVQVHGERIRLMDFKTKKVIFKDKLSQIKGSILAGIAQSKSNILVSFNFEDSVMALKTQDFIRLIDIKNLSRQSTGEKIFTDLTVPDKDITLFSFIKPGYTLMYANKERMCRVKLASGRKIESVKMSFGNFSYFPSLKEPQVPLVSWVVNTTGDIWIKNHSKDTSLKVTDCLNDSTIMRMCSLPDNSVMGYVTSGGFARIVEVSTGRELLNKCPIKETDNVNLATNSIEQDSVIFQTGDSNIWLLNLAEKRLDLIYDLCYPDFVSIIGSTKKNVLYTLDSSGNVEMYDILKKQKSETPLFTIELRESTKRRSNALRMINKTNTLVACGKSKVIFYDCEFRRLERVFDICNNQPLLGHVFSECWLSDDDRFLAIYCSFPTEKILLVRTSNLGLMQEYNLDHPLFKEVSFSGGSNYMTFIFEDLIRTYNLDTFGNALSDLLLNSGLSSFMSFDFKRSFDFNIYQDLTSLSAFCFLSSEIGSEFSCIKIFDDLIREFNICKKEGRIDPLSKFVEGPNFGWRDLLVWNGFLIKSNSREIQEIINTQIYERTFTNPYQIDPFSHFLEIMNERKIFLFFGEVFFQIYFANFMVPIQNKGKRSIIVDSVKQENGIEKTWLSSIEEGYEEEIVGDLKNIEAVKSITNIYRTRLDVFDKELENPMFLKFFALLNILPYSLYKNPAMAKMTDFYWKKYKWLGEMYLSIYCVFVIFIWIHTFFVDDPGIQLVDILLIAFFIFFFIFYICWESIILYFTGIDYFLSYTTYLTLAQMGLLVAYICDVCTDGKVDEILCSCNMFFACIKAFLLMQYVDGIRQFSTRIIQVCYDIRVFFGLVLMLTWSFSLIFYTISTYSDKSVLASVVLTFDFFFANWDLETDYKLFLFYQLLLMIAFPIIAFNVLIALVNASWDYSGELGDAFDRKKVMGLLNSNFNVLRWVYKVFLRNRNGNSSRSSEKMYIYMYMKPERKKEVDPELQPIQDIQKLVLSVEESQEKLKNFLSQNEVKGEK